MNRSIGDLASRPVVSVDVDALVVDALQLMSVHRISCIVTLCNEEPVGILTERDIVFAANWVIGQPSLRVREVMSKPVLTAPAETTVAGAYRIFRENGIRHLVVLGDRMELDGIFTQTDLVRALRGEVFASTADVTPLMSKHVCSVNSRESARHALSLMASHAISGVVVVEGQRPVGVFTERDAVRLVAAGIDLTCLPVGSVMSAPVVTIPVAATPCRAIDMMRDHEVRRLLVLDHEGALVGVLTQTDLSRIIDHSHQPVASIPGTAGVDGVSANPAMH